MRQDGKFVVNGDIPEGQGSVTGLLSECFELAFDLRELSQEKEEEAQDGGNESGPDDESGLTAPGGVGVSVGVK